MTIDPRSIIAGLPALRVRHYLRSVQPFGGTLDSIRAGLKMSDRNARSFLCQLRGLGLIEITDEGFVVADKGIRLCAAKATKPIYRSTADRIVVGLITRVEAVNESSAFLYDVVAVAAFGSYITGKPRLGDIDLAYDLVRRESNWARHLELCHAQTIDAEANGRRFDNYTQSLNWPLDKVRLALQARSRYIAFIPWSRLIDRGFEYRIIWQSELPVAEKDRFL